MALRAVPGARLLAAGPDRGRRDRSRRCEGGPPSCCSGRARRRSIARALDALARGATRWRRPGVGALAIALDRAADLPKVRAASSAALPVIAREPGAGPELRDPQPSPVHEPAGPAPADGPAARRAGTRRQGLPRRAWMWPIVRARRGGASRRRRPSVSRAPCRFPARSTRRRPLRNYLPYGRELLDQGLEAAAVVAFERAAQAEPERVDAVSAGHAARQELASRRARGRRIERALALQPDLAEASNDLGALLAQGGELEAAIARFRAALAAAPDYPDALNNLGYALLLSGARRGSARALREGAGAPARFSRGAQQPGPALRPRRGPG